MLRQQDAVLKATERARTDPAALQKVQDAKQKLEDAQRTLEAVAGPPGLQKFVSSQQRQHVVDLVLEFYQQVKQQGHSAWLWELMLIIAGVALAFVSSRLSILSWNKAAAFASALVVVAGGVPVFLAVPLRRPAIA